MNQGRKCRRSTGYGRAAPAWTFYFTLGAIFLSCVGVESASWASSSSQRLLAQQEMESGSGSAPQGKKKRKKKKSKRKKSTKPENSNKSSPNNPPSDQAISEPSFVVSGVSAEIMTIEFERKFEIEELPQVGDQMYVLQEDGKGIVAIVLVELVAPSQGLINARLVEVDDEIVNEQSLLGLSLITSSRYLESPQSFSSGPIKPQRQSALHFLARSTDGNLNLLALYGMGLGVMGETRAIIAEETVPAGMRSLIHVSGYLPIFSDFVWLNWLGFAFESWTFQEAKLKIEDSLGNVAQEATAKGSKSTLWMSLKPYWNAFMLKGEIRFELSRNQEIEVSIPADQALVKSSLIALRMKDDKARLHVGMEARLSSTGFVQISGVVPLEQRIDVVLTRAEGEPETTTAKMTEVSADMRFIYLLTFYKRPHQIALATSLGASYDQRSYQFESGIESEVTTPPDVAPYFMMGLSYSQ